MAAFSARMLVCSEMSLISSTIEPISCELSPRRLMRLEVSWIWSRIESMPAIVSRTTPAPLVAICTERCATSADSAELRETWSMLEAISVMRVDAELISCAWCSAASARCMAVACVSCALEATCAEVSLMVPTRSRRFSTAKLMESAIAPVMSSVTVAFTVRSFSASAPISSSRRMIASWLRLLSSIVSS